MNKAKAKPRKNNFGNVWIVLTFIFLYIPIFIVVLFSFNTSRVNIVFEGFTIKWYGSFFQNTILMDSLKNTLIIAVASTVISTIVGTLGAIGMERYNFPGKKLVDALLYVPIVIPEIVLGVAMLAIFSLTHIPMGLFSITLGHITFCVPFVVISVRAGFAGYDKALEEASMDLGSNRIKTFLNITLPLLKPGIISGAILALSLSLDDVIISFFVSGPGSTTLPLAILDMQRHGISPDVNALSTIITFLTILVIGINTHSQIRAMKNKAA
ncbi:MAG: ABC transporter permease [Eubacterium sp.]|nr:ABC transporter permease [Eubacterium sp.]